jgi:hypothetical protein
MADDQATAVSLPSLMMAADCKIPGRLLPILLVSSNVRSETPQKRSLTTMYQNVAKPRVKGGGETVAFVGRVKMSHDSKIRRSECCGAECRLSAQNTCEAGSKEESRK